MFIDRIKELQFEMTQAAMDEKCGLPNGTIAQYLGGRQPTIDNAQKIAKAFNVTLDWLFGQSISVTHKCETLMLFTFGENSENIDFIIGHFQFKGGVSIYECNRDDKRLIIIPGSQLNLMKDTINEYNRKHKNENIAN